LLACFLLQVPPLGAGESLGVVFTAISLVRSYALRRWFNGLTVKQLHPKDCSK